MYRFRLDELGQEIGYQNRDSDFELFALAVAGLAPRADDEAQSRNQSGSPVYYGAVWDQVTNRWRSDISDIAQQEQAWNSWSRTDLP